jgi:hypothetical protein
VRIRQATYTHKITRKGKQNKKRQAKIRIGKEQQHSHTSSGEEREEEMPTSFSLLLSHFRRKRDPLLSFGLHCQKLFRKRAVVLLSLMAFSSVKKHQTFRRNVLPPFLG